jgi:N-acetylglucosaminyldiphosphoundecaprenol N-acetyl-beta-D-mannosaminyltransferase
MTTEHMSTSGVEPGGYSSVHPPWQKRSAMPTVRIGVVPICGMRLAEVLQAIDEVIERRNPSYACFCGAHLCVCAARDSRVRRALQEADFCLPDGVATTLGARLLGERLPERLPGPSVMLDICQHGVARGYRHFFYGGAQGIPDRLAQKLRERFPGLQVAGTYSPPFRELTPEEDEEVVDRINRCAPDIVWVGLGAPKQEIWAWDHRGRLSAPLILTVGAAFDFNSGSKRRAPPWVRTLGFEWLFRMLTEGRQMFSRYTRIVPMFEALILKQALWRVLGKEEDLRKSPREA